MNLEIRDAEIRDLPEIKRLMDEYLSLNYYSLEALEGMLCGDRHLLYVVTDADRDHAVVSYFYAFLSSLDEALQILHVAERPEPLLQYRGDDLVAVYKASSTEKGYRKLGICSTFIRDLQPVVQQRGAKMILATALHPAGQRIPMKHIFVDNGFSAISDLYRPWSQINSYCPYCREDYCTCDAVFYMKKLDGMEGVNSNE